MSLEAPLPRLLFAAAVVVLLSPAAYGAATAGGPSGGVDASEATNVTFVTTQGNEMGQGAGIYAVATDSKRVLWSHTDYAKKYYDVDPLGDDRVLFTAKTGNYPAHGGDGYPWKAVVANWRTGEIVDTFSVPPDTHDVDYLGDGRYLVANKASNDGTVAAWARERRRNGWFEDSTAKPWHRIYVFNRSSDEVVWEYSFAKHFPPTAGDGVGDGRDYTHLNDVDIADDGSAVLASPREFDRVVLIDRSTKELRWTLGAEDAHAVLHEQHNPVLLSADPPTVLVADSENDRVVEYAKSGETWERTWVYRDVRWPRDADRLPDGNTLIVDTEGERVVEVTPDGRVVWRYRVARAPYDVERLRLGDEPRGPTMRELGEADAGTPNADAGVVSTIVGLWRDYYAYALWVLPPWVRLTEFTSLHAAFLAVVGWVAFERRRTSKPSL